MKNWFPKTLKIGLRSGKRLLQDIRQGYYRKLTSYSRQKISLGSTYVEEVSIEQPIHLGDYRQNKIHNLSLAIDRIQNLCIEPGEIFSFWKVLGPPLKKKGYLPGRSLKNDSLQATTGGGLCQLAGLIFFLAIKSGLSVLERHSHSFDLYSKSSRFTPLGTDAAVVYAYKDLRFINNLNFPICCRFILEPDKIKGMICAPESVHEYTINIKIYEIDQLYQVDLFRSADTPVDREFIGSSHYRKYGLNYAGV